MTRGLTSANATAAGAETIRPVWFLRLDFDAGTTYYAGWHAPFAWGRNDCLLFAGGAIEAMTGVDPFAPARGLYKTRRQAAAALGEDKP